MISQQTLSSSQLWLFLVSLSLLLAVSTIDATSSVPSNETVCTVCRILVSEANWAVEQIDPKKIIEHGSFRVDPNGHQPYKKKKKYARSESYLEELLEDICDKFRNYAELTNQPPLESKHIVRWTGFNKERLQSKDLKLDYDVGKNLIYKCNDFLEEYFDDVIDSLQKEDIKNYEKFICGEEAAHVCSEEQLSMPMMTLPEAPEDDPNDHPEDELETEEVHPDEVDRTIPIEEKMAMMDSGEEEEEEDYEHETLEEYEKMHGKIKDEL